MNPFLHTALLDIESTVAEGGWDQPVRVFALAETAAILREEPALMAQFTAAGIDLSLIHI